MVGGVGGVVDRILRDEADWVSSPDHIVVDVVGVVVGGDRILRDEADWVSNPDHNIVVDVVGGGVGVDRILREEANWVSSHGHVAVDVVLVLVLTEYSDEAD